MATHGYKRMTVEIDAEALRVAQETLRTNGVEETVNAALRAVGRTMALQGAADYVLKGKLHVPDEETWAAWRARRR
jgi:Arc/MetJ family transcription regulator